MCILECPKINLRYLRCTKIFVVVYRFYNKFGSSLLCCNKVLLFFDFTKKVWFFLLCRAKVDPDNPSIRITWLSSTTVYMPYDGDDLFL